MKPRILTFINYFLPGYKSGGPIRTISNMVDHLKDDFDFLIVTRDRDKGDTKPYKGIVADKWTSFKGASVFYASKETMRIRALKNLITETPHEVMYLNSFFNPLFSINPLIIRKFTKASEAPLILAPRGEFSEGALKLKSLKKRSFLAASKIAGLHKDITWQASSEFEKEDIRKEMGGIAQRIIVAPDLLPLLKTIPGDNGGGREGAALRVVFLSRIAPMKNLDYALEVLRRITFPLVFNVYGIIDDRKYWEKCKEMMEKLPQNIKAVYYGPVEHGKVLDTLADHDLFFLPTRGENFGHVIFESLLAGTPILISDQTPWRDLEEKGVGWVKSLDEMEGFVQVITEFANRDRADKNEQKIRASKYAIEHANHGGALKANQDLFRLAILERPMANHRKDRFPS